MIDKSITHFKIVDQFGEGRVGVIYKAHSQKFDYFLSLKSPPIQLTVNKSEKALFINEAQVVAALNHLILCNIYEIDEFGDQTSIAWSA